MTTSLAVSGNVSQLRESATLALMQRVRTLRAEGRPVIDLGLGEPNFETPAYIRRAAQQAIDQGATRYTAVEGILPLREVIAAQASARLAGGPPVVANEVVVTTGSKQALFGACFCLFGEGDDVLIPTPAWTSYYDMVELARARVIVVEGAAENGLKPTVADLERAATPRTRGLILNSPCNPTGSVLTHGELTAIARLAAEREWWIISDEIYRRIAYDGEATSALSIADTRDRLVVVDGMAKAYAMTGWRMGWAIAPEAVARTMTALQSHMTSNATTVSQHATLAALSNTDEGDRAVGQMVAQYRRRRDAAVAVLSAVPGLRFVRPEGAFYIFIDVRDTAPPGSDAGAAFAARLLDAEGVAVMPGAAFRAPGWIRLTYATPESEVTEGIRRVVKCWSEARR
jgi:aspartate aminotransferase